VPVAGSQKGSHPFNPFQQCKLATRLVGTGWKWCRTGATTVRVTRVNLATGLPTMPSRRCHVSCVADVAFPRAWLSTAYNEPRLQYSACTPKGTAELSEQTLYYTALKAPLSRRRTVLLARLSPVSMHGGMVHTAMKLTRLGWRIRCMT